MQPASRWWPWLALAIPLAGSAGSRAPNDLRDAPQAANHRYEQIVILAPRHQDTVFNNAGHLDIMVLMSPPAGLDAGDAVELYLDGQVADSAHPTAAGFAVDGVTRGSHWLQVRIADAAELTVIASAPVQIFMWQASRFFPNRQ